MLIFEEAKQIFGSRNVLSFGPIAKSINHSCGVFFTCCLTRCMFHREI